MPNILKPDSVRISLGQCTDKGVKPLNQDFHSSRIPQGAPLLLKGATFAIADGISSSPVSHIASETAVKSFLDDYYCSSDAWTVKHAAQRVLAATNGWLHAQGQRSEARYNANIGYVCTFSALIVKARTAHLVHIGDSRIYRLRSGSLEQLTKDHRLWISQEESYLSRALGISEEVQVDYQSLPLQTDDCFLLCTDGIAEFCDTDFLIQALQQDDPDTAATAILQHALEQGSDDNLTLQIVRIDQLPEPESQTLLQQIGSLPLPPPLTQGDEFDGYRLLRSLDCSSRSHIWQAEDLTTAEQVILKIPATDQSEDPAYLERLLMEEWVARRIDNPYVMKAAVSERPRNYLYTATEYIDGQTLAQWQRDNSTPDLESVRRITEQIANGLQAIHRMEILHQDLKPDNVMIDRHGCVRIIDFGSARVAGIVEADARLSQPDMLGTALYMAPEYFIGEAITPRADLYSMAVITYFLLSGRYPYDTQVSRARTASAQRRLVYHPVLDDEREIPVWLDATLKKALHPSPWKRYPELSEFIYDLRHPAQAFLNRSKPPLIERSPVKFWQTTSAILTVTVIVLLHQLLTLPHS